MQAEISVPKCYHCHVTFPADGKDDSIGVLSKLNGPVVIRFVSDDKPGFAVSHLSIGLDPAQDF